MPTTLDRTQATNLFRRPPDQLVEVAGDAAVAVRTTGDGPDVLLVHGWPVSGATWRQLLPHLVEHVTCHVVDLPGAGDSRFHRSSTIDLRTHVRSLQLVVDALGLDRFAVVGHDSGGMMARHAFAGDDRVRGLGLVDTEQSAGIHWRFRAFLLPARLPGFAHALAWAGGRRRLRRNPLLLGDCFHDRSLLDGAFDELFLAPLRDDPDRRWAAGQLARHFDTSMVDELADVHAHWTAPTQLVWGADDPFFPVERAEAMLPEFGGPASLHVVPEAKLFVHEEHPAEVAAALLPTLTG